MQSYVPFGFCLDPRPADSSSNWLRAMLRYGQRRNPSCLFLSCVDVPSIDTVDQRLYAKVTMDGWQSSTSRSVRHLLCIDWSRPLHRPSISAITHHICQQLAREILTPNINAQENEKHQILLLTFLHRTTMLAFVIYQIPRSPTFSPLQHLYVHSSPQIY